MSTTRFTILKQMEKIITQPRTAGVSLALILLIRYVPTPGHENTDSVSTAPPRREPN